MLATKTNNSRTGKSAVNLLTGVLSQIVILVLNFAIRYLFIQKIGYEYLGINSLFTSILTVLSVADLGFGSALGIVLYSSLSKKNEEEIAGLMNFFKKVYLIVGLIVTAVGLAITPFVKYLVNTDHDIPNLSLYFLLFLLNTVSSYFISYRAILIRADQKNSVVNNVTTIVKIAKAVLEALVLIVIPRFLGLTATYFFYLGVMVLATYAIGVITAIYAKKNYDYAFGNKTKVSQEKKKELISTTKDLFIYRLCSAFSTPIDSIIISVFVGTLVLGIYSNYLLIFTTLMEFICIVSRNVISSVGNFVVERPIEEQKKLYFELQIIYFAIIIFCTINFVSLATPFISLVFKAESTLSVWTVFLMGATLISRCIGELAIIFRETTKIYKRTKYISLFYTTLHVGLSLLLGYYMGLEGILLGNVIAYFITNFWYELFALFKWYFKENPARVFAMFLYVLFITCGISVAMYYASIAITASGDLLSFVIACAVSLIVSFLTLFALYPVPGFNLLFKRAKRVVIAIYKKISIIHSHKKVQLAVLVCYVISLTGLILVRDTFGVDINKFIFFVLLVVATLLCSRNNGIFLILFTLPVSPSLAELYILVYALVYLLFVSFKSHSIGKWLFMMSVPLTIFILEIVLSLIYGTIHINLALRILVLLSILAIIFYDRKLFTKKHIYAFTLGILYLLFILAINWFIPAVYGITHKNPFYSWLSLKVLFREVRFGYSTLDWVATQGHVDYPFKITAQVTENPNNIGLVSIIGMTTMFALYGTAKKKEKWFIISSFLLFVIFGIWSQSRTFIVLLAAALIVFIFLPNITKRRNILSSLICLTFIVLFLTVLLLSNPDFVKNIVNRFKESSTSTGGFRFTLIADYFKFIFSDWKYALFGVGCSNLLPMSGLDVVPHTNFVQFIGSYGIIVFAGFVVLLTISLTRTKKIKFKSPEVYLIVPTLFTIAFTFTLQLFLPSIVLLSFVPGVLCLSMLNKDISPEKELMYCPVTYIKLENGAQVNLVMCSTSFGGGIGSYIANVSPCLAKNNIHVSLLYNPDTTENEISRYSKIDKTEHRYDKKRSWFKLFRLQSKYKYYRDYFEEFKPNIIYINTSSYARSLILIMSAINYRCSRIIIHCHNPVNSKSHLSFFELIIRWFVTFADFSYFACSKESGKVFFGKSFMSGQNKNDAVITNFINVNRFKYNEAKRTKIRRKLEYTDNDVIIGNVGRLDDQKNQKFIIELISNLPKKYKGIIVGDGPLKNSLENLIERFGVRNRVKLIGNTPDIDKYYCSFDFFVLPSLVEGLPFVSVEAQCNGLLNLLNEELPNSTKISDKVVFLPLKSDLWGQFIKNSHPISKEERANGYKDVIEAGFSNDKAPEKIVSKIKEIAYE